jgi:acyl-CoA synthetase (AMP-forming)/AMP-acid ligase II
MEYTHTNFFDYLFENTKDLEKPFILNPKEVISFKDLYNKCLILSEYLIERIGTGQNILILSPNSQFFIIIYLATIKSGNVIVPLNYEIEQRNLDYILNLCESKLVFTTSQYKQKLDFKGTSILDESALEEILSGKNVRQQPTPTRPTHPVSSIQHPVSSSPSSLQFTASSLNSLAQIIFTSGSTGEPKGVMISHKNLMANTGSIVKYLELTERDIMLVVLPFYYCYGLSLLHTHLLVGGSIVLNNMFIMLGGVINDLKRYNCTGFAGVPTHFQILLRKSDSFKTTAFPYLKYVTQAGGKLHNAFIREFITTFPDIRFNVMYGQTEATARLSWLPPEKLKEKIGSCGREIPGVELFVADEHNNKIKAGEIGEILACGDNIMQGYYKDRESTSRVLIDCMLHTGDLATVDNEGYIYLTARKKEFVKVGGRRVNPKEIEEVIVSMPNVVDCSIEAVFDEILGETMKATVIVKEKTEAPVTIDSIKSWCGASLASFKIPQIIELKEKFSITATGKKVKRQA